MKKLLTFVSYVLVAVLASVATLAMTAPQPSQEGGFQTAKLEELADLLQQVFIGETDVTALEEGAAMGMVDALGDRWSYYMTAREYDAYLEQMENSYVGVGITVTQREDGYVDILKVEPGSPAEEAGILAGDFIVAVEGQDIAQWTLDDVKSVIRGKEGTKVSLTVRREGKDLPLSVERRRIQTVVASGELVDENIGLVTIVNFDSRCASETVAIIEDLLTQGAEKLIFDVRFNPGGYKDELVRLLDYLLPEGPLFRSVDYRGNEQVDQSDEKCLNIPMAVLINGDSYSAAEFFAAALQEYDAAVTVGQPTTGKGYFQSAYELSDGSAAVISVGKYTTPEGVSLANVGLTPDVTVEVSEEMYQQLLYGNVEKADDPQLQAAIEALKNQ